MSKNNAAILLHRFFFRWERFLNDFLLNGKVIETREMITQYQDLEEPTVHSMQYAEDAAENYCLGYIPADGRRANDT